MDFKLTKLGFSTLHGAHQEAQKSNNITLDLTSLKETGLANKSGPVNSGAKLPIEGVSLSFLRSSIFFLISIDDFVFFIISVNLEK